MNKLLLKIRFKISNSFFIMKISKSIWKENRFKGREISYISNTYKGNILKNSQWRVKILKIFEVS